MVQTIRNPNKMAAILSKHSKTEHHRTEHSKSEHVQYSIQVKDLSGIQFKRKCPIANNHDLNNWPLSHTWITICLLFRSWLELQTVTGYLNTRLLKFRFWCWANENRSFSRGEVSDLKKEVWMQETWRRFRWKGRIWQIKKNNEKYYDELSGIT